MKKEIRKFLKQEKRLVKLMYRKGIFKDFNIDIKRKGIGWEAFTNGLPELHDSTENYFGEGDSYSIVGRYLNTLKLGSIDGMCIYAYTCRDKVIKTLNRIPTKVFDSKINNFLKVKYEY